MPDFALLKASALDYLMNLISTSNADTRRDMNAMSSRGDILLLDDAGTGTAQDKSFVINAVQAHITLSAGRLVLFYWSVNNSGPDPVATIGSEPFTIRGRNGTPLDPADLVGGNRYLCSILNTPGQRQLRIIGAVGISDITGLPAQLSQRSLAIRDSGILPITNVAGTGDAVTADLTAAMISAGITTLSAMSEIEYVPQITNGAVSPTLTIGGSTYEIRGSDGQTWPANGFVVGRSYKLRRRNTTLRVVGGDVTAAETAQMRLDRIVAAAQTGTVALEGIAGTGDAITAVVPSELTATGLAASLLRAIRWTWPATSNTGPATMNIDGQGPVSLRDANGADLPAGYGKPGRLYRADKSGSNWIISSGEIMTQDVAAVVSVEALARTDADAARDDQPWPGDDAVLAEGTNGMALVTKSSGRTRGTFTADDVFPGSYNDLLRVGEPDLIRDRVLNDGWPGDRGEVLAVAQNGIAAGIDEYGRYRGDMVIDGDSGWPGDWIFAEVVDARGVVLRGWDKRDKSEFSQPLDVTGWPGDWVIGLTFDRTGRILEGKDVRDGSAYPAGQSGGGGGGGGSVEFVDPGFVGDAFGAVIDSEGVIKFQTIVAPGAPLGMEKRDGRFFADTQHLAIALLAIGGGDTGLASSVEDHRWHVFDEALEPQDTHTAASGLASAILTRQRDAYQARSLMFPIAEVIGSTVEADVLAGSPRRAQIMARLQAAVDAAERWGKTLMVGWIQMDLMDGAPATPQATAREHYGLVGNGMRLEASGITGQAGAPNLIVNQGFGTRTDGTSEVILAEGRLDWDFFSIGFITPTPLYPYPLAAGTQATLTPDALLLVRELESLAIAETGAGREWFCPSLEEATRAGAVITARFATLSGLVLRDPANHGFSLSGSNVPAISSVTVSGSYATITLASAPAGPVTLNYAFGQTGTPSDAKPINRGSLTDSWSQMSSAVPASTLYRYARSGRVTSN